MSLADQNCKPCNADSRIIETQAARVLLGKLQHGWQFTDTQQAIYRDFTFGNYYETIAFVNAIAWLAQQQDHHPRLYIDYRSCRVEYTSWMLNGLSLNDFICAAKVDQLLHTSAETDSDAELFDDNGEIVISALPPEPEPQENIGESTLTMALEPTTPQPIADDIREPSPAVYNDADSITSRTVVMSATEFQDISPPNTEDPGEATIPDNAHARTVVMNLSELRKSAASENSHSSQMDMEKTLVMSPQELDFVPGKTDEAKAPVDPAIEDDDTLVMHANTFERVQQ